MEKIVMLGTGNGGTLNLYNTCFVVQNDKGDFLVDTGGSIELLKRLSNAGINYKDIKHIFISHSHTDHILGLIWMFKKLGRAAINGEIKTKINIYCNDVVYEAIMEVSRQILPDKLVNGVFDHGYFINFVDFNVIFLLVAMMIIVSITTKSGVFNWLANELLRFTKGHPIKVLFALGKTLKVVPIEEK